MELVGILLLVLGMTTAVPLFASFAAQGGLRRRIHRSERIVAALQDLGLPPSGGLLPGAPPVLVYRDPDDVVVVTAHLSWPLGLVRGAAPAGYRPLGDAARVTLEALRTCHHLGVTVYDGEIRMRVVEGGDLLHPIDAVRELHELLERPPLEAVEETALAAAWEPRQLAASLGWLAAHDRPRAERLARAMTPGAPPRSRIELAAVLRDGDALVAVALTAVGSGDHVVAWEAARRLAHLPGEVDAALGAAAVLTPHEVTAGGLLRGLAEARTDARDAWLGAEVRAGLARWADGQRGRAAATWASWSVDEEPIAALLGCPWPEARTAAVEALRAWGTVRAVPWLREAQRLGAVPGALVDRAVAAIQERAGGVPGGLALADLADDRGHLSESSLPGGHVDLAE
jgi:hypothetical protein